MKTKEEQIQALFGENIYMWACRQLDRPEDIYNKKYSDFINITEEEIWQYIREKGFIPKISPYPKVSYSIEECCFCILEEKNRWGVFWFERGQKNILSLFESKESAERYVLKELMSSVQIQLNNNYKIAHPK